MMQYFGAELPIDKRKKVGIVSKKDLTYNLGSATIALVSGS
jgi:hypothetical protein